MNTEVMSEPPRRWPIPSLFIGALLLLFSCCTLLALTLAPQLRDSVESLHELPAASLLLMMLAGGYLLCCLIDSRRTRLKAQRVLSSATIALSATLLYLTFYGTDSSLKAHLPALNSLLAYLIAGGAALLNSLARSFSHIATIFLLTLFVAALAIFGLTGHILGYEPIFTGFNARYMSPVTAISLLLLAAGLTYTTWWCHRRNVKDPVSGITVISSILLIFSAMIGAGLIYAVTAAYLHTETRNDLLNLLNERSSRIVEKLHHAEELARLLTLEAQHTTWLAPTNIIGTAYALKVTDDHGNVVINHNADWFDQPTTSAIRSKDAILWRGKVGHCQFRLSQKVGNRLIETSVPFDLSPILNAPSDQKENDNVILCGYQTDGRLQCLSSPHESQLRIPSWIDRDADQSADSSSTIHIYNDRGNTLALMKLPEYGLLAYMENDEERLLSPLYVQIYYMLPLALLLIGASIGLITWRIHPLARHLHRSERRYRTVVDGAADAIFLHDSNRRFLEVNTAAATLLGYTRHELIGKHPNDFLLPEDHTDALLQFRKLNPHNNILNARRKLRRKDGSLISVEIRTTALDSGELISIVRDISEQERTEAVLREKERFTRSVVEVLAEGVIVYQLDGVIVYTNQAAAEILRQEELVSPGASGYSEEWSIIHEDNSEFTSDTYPLARTLKEGISLREVIMGILCPDGERVWISVNTDPLLDEMKSQVIGAVVSFSNITHKRKTEHELYLSRERLRALSSHLQQVREEEKSSIAREIHDELGSSLSAIKLGLEWISQRSTTESPELRNRIAHLNQVTDQAILSTRRLVTQLRLSLLEDLGLWAALEWLLQDFATNSEIEVSHHIHCIDAELSSQQAIAIYRVIQEALTNIVKHAKASRVHLDCWMSDGKLHVVLEDDGIGMDEDIMLNINSYGIRGMYERIGQINGHLQILGTPGEGTLIALAIPLTSNTHIEMNGDD